MFTDDKSTDNYATDKVGWELIQDYIPKDKKIWSPFYCDGKMKDYFEEMGYDIYHKDKDFFSYEPSASGKKFSCKIYILLILRH